MPLSPISIFEVDDCSIFDNSSFSMGYDREEKNKADSVPDAVISLYKCLKRNPRFKDNKKWEGMPSMAELQGYLMQEVVRLCPAGFQWAYDLERDHNTDFTGKWCLFYYKEGPAQTHCVPLEWIQEIKIESEELYTLVRCLIAKVTFRFGLDFVDNQYNEMVIDCPEEYMMGEDPDSEEFLKRDVSFYKNGPPREYLETLHRYSKLFSDSELERLIFEFYKGLRNPLLREICNWLLYGIDALKNPTRIYNYFFEPLQDMENGMPVNVKDMFAFPWSFHDQVFDQSERWIESASQEIGMQGPTLYTVYSADKVVKNMGDEPLKALTRFMDAGRKIYFKHYNNHFKHLREESESVNNILEEELT